MYPITWQANHFDSTLNNNSKKNMKYQADYNQTEPAELIE